LLHLGARTPDASQSSSAAGASHAVAIVACLARLTFSVDSRRPRSMQFTHATG
jgi:hypothetical protein